MEPDESTTPVTPAGIEAETKHLRTQTWLMPEACREIAIGPPRPGEYLEAGERVYHADWEVPADKVDEFWAAYEAARPQGTGAHPDPVDLEPGDQILSPAAPGLTERSPEPDPVDAGASRAEPVSETDPS